MTSNGHAANGNGVDIAFHQKENGKTIYTEGHNGNLKDLASTLAENSKTNGANREIGNVFNVKDNMSDNGNGHIELENGTTNGEEKVPRRLDEYEVDFS
jgi:hypothetical protein